MENPRETLCGKPTGSTHADSPRQLPTDHDCAVSTREYQNDQPSRQSLRLLPLLHSRGKKKRNETTRCFDRSFHIRVLSYIWTPPGSQQGRNDRRTNRDRMQSYIRPVVKPSSASGHHGHPRNAGGRARGLFVPVARVRTCCCVVFGTESFRGLRCYAPERRVAGPTTGLTRAA
jgi:hypothetical protein